MGTSEQNAPTMVSSQAVIPAPSGLVFSEGGHKYPVVALRIDYADNMVVGVHALHISSRGEITQPGSPGVTTKYSWG